MTDTALRIDAVTVRRGARTLGPWSTTVEAGEIQQWSGPNGSGKSTLIEAVCGLVDCASGAIGVAGAPELQKQDPFERPVTVLFQDLGLWPRKRIGEQIELIRKHSPLAGDPLEGMFEDVIERLGVQPFWKRRPEELSLGEQQRCALARTLAKPASVVLLDEPMSAQDAASRERVEGVIALLQEAGKAIVVASHVPIRVATSDASELFDSSRPEL